MKHAWPVWCGWLLMLVVPGSALCADDVVDLALVIGNNHYVGDPTRDLRYADDDALSAAENFLELHPYGALWLLVDPDAETLAIRPSARLLAHRPPTIDAWDQALTEMARVVSEARSRPNVRIHLFLHFSGHGERGGILHFADQRLPARSFRLSLARVGADEVFALMDGCHLAQVVRDGDRTTTLPPPPIFDDSEMTTPERPRWLGIIGATTAAPEHDYFASGLLTLVGLSALRGPADLNDDGKITFREWGRYVASQFSGQAGGPQVVVVPPRKDHQATVIDLDATRLGGIRLEPGFPHGQVRIVQGMSRRLIAEVYHEGLRPTVIRLRPGSYTLLRFLRRDTWLHPGYPAERIQLVVGRDITALDLSSSGRFVVLLPEGMKGEGDPPDGTETWIISANEERSILNSPFRRTHERARFARPHWTLRVGAPSPRVGPDLGGTGEPRPGGLVRLARTWPCLDRGRWFLSAGVVFQVSTVRYADLWVNAKSMVSGALHNEARVGPLMVQDLVLRRGRLGLGLGVAWAPGVVTDGVHFLDDPSADAEGISENRFLFLGNTSADVTVAWTPWWNRSPSIGPFVRIELLRFQLPSVTDGPRPVSWERGLAAGIGVSW